MTIDAFLNQLTTIQQLANNQWLLSTSVIACLLSLCLLLRSQVRMRVIAKKNAHLERELKVMSGSVIAMGQQVMALQKQMQQLKQPTKQNITPAEPTKQSVQFDSNTLLKTVTDENPYTSNSNDTDSSYDAARKLLSKGNTIESVADQCSLSFAEVSLLQALNRPSSAISH